MKKISTRIIGLLLAIIFCTIFMLSSCQNGKTNAVPTVSDKRVLLNEKFGGIYLEISIDDFNSYGFEYGDSVDITFSNGRQLTDIPYFNGFYVRYGEFLVVAYPGYPYIYITKNYCDGVYKEMDMNDSVTATVKLNTKAKYSNVQNSMNIVYSNERKDYISDEIFANFRPLTGGNIKKNIFYRSASPMDNAYNRAPYVDSLIKSVGIQLIVDLADNDNEIKSYMDKPAYDSPYAKSLYEKGKIALLDMSVNFMSQTYKQKIVQGMKAVLQNDGPYLINCQEGKDRTGFVAMLIEALCGATISEIKKDYMITYDNYYGVNETNNKPQYDTILNVKASDMFIALTGIESEEQLHEIDLQKKAADYLMSGGMTAEEVSELTKKLTNS